MPNTTAAALGAVFVDGTSITITAGGEISAAPGGLTDLTNSLAADVALTNAGQYYVGPSVAAPAETTRCFVSGTVTCVNAAPTRFNAKLWDGTSEIASTSQPQALAGGYASISLSGRLAGAPAGNLRIEVADLAGGGSIQHNATGIGLDSTITVLRTA